MSKLVVSRFPEIGLIAAGMTFVVLITMLAHSFDRQDSVREFQTWGLRPSFDPMNPAEQKTLAGYQPSAPEHAWEE